MPTITVSAQTNAIAGPTNPKNGIRRNRRRRRKADADTSADEKALLLVKRREKILKESRKKEWDQAQAKKLHRGNCGQETFDPEPTEGSVWTTR